MKITSQRKKKRINQNVQLVPRGSERSGLIKIRTWTFEELTDLKPDYRQDWLSHPFLGFHCQLNLLLQHANFSGDRYLFSNKWTKNAMTISEFIEYSPSYLLILIPSRNTAQRRTQHKDFNKFRQQRQIIQITKKRCSIAFQPKWKKTKSQDLLINLLCFSKKIFEDKVISESFDRFVKTNQQNENEKKSIKFPIIRISKLNAESWNIRSTRSKKAQYKVMIYAFWKSC